MAGPDTPTNPPPADAGKEPAASPLVRLAIEIGPLIVFFVANARWGIFVGTGAFMVAIVAALVASRVIEKRWPVMPLVTAVFVLVFGALTLYLENDLFIKLKPTIVNLLFAAILFGGLLSGRSLLKPLLGTAMQLRDEGWRALTFRWACFFVVLAGVNEVLWRNVSTDTYVTMKLVAIVPLTIAFMMTQMPLIQRHMIEEEGGSGASDPPASGEL